MIHGELATFVQEGVGIYIGTRNGALEPNGARALASLLEQDGARLVIYLADEAAVRVLPDLESNGQAAVTFGRPIDERAIQVKGTFAGARPAREDERPALDAQWDNFSRSLEMIGVPRVARSAWPRWPATAITLVPTAIFEQTPGPSAGTKLA
jgi:hypothetical protein